MTRVIGRSWLSALEALVDQKATRLDAVKSRPVAVYDISGFFSSGKERSLGHLAEHFERDVVLGITIAELRSATFVDPIHNTLARAPKTLIDCDLIHRILLYHGRMTDFSFPTVPVALIIPGACTTTGQ